MRVCKDGENNKSKKEVNLLEIIRFNKEKKNKLKKEREEHNNNVITSYKLRR